MKARCITTENSEKDINNRDTQDNQDRGLFQLVLPILAILEIPVTFYVLCVLGVLGGFWFSPILLFANSSVSRIEALIHIGDAQQALSELKVLLAEDPDNATLQRLEVLSLAKYGDIPALLKAYSCYRSLAKEAIDRQTLEEVAWTIIRKASQSSSPLIRQEACIASFMANDAKGIPLCLNAMKDQSEHLRLVAYLFAARSRDEVLLDQAKYALEHENSPSVRLAAIQTVGSARYEAAKETLQRILETKALDAQEKMASLDALTRIMQQVDSSLIHTLATSERASQRALACELVLEHFDQRQLEHLFPLMHDAVFDVRLTAIQCVGIVRSMPPKEQLDSLLLHPDIKTKILASWLCLRLNYKSDEAQDLLRRALVAPDKTLRLFAAGAIVHVGETLEAFSDAFLLSDDPLVRLNLAIGFIWQRQDLLRSCRYLLEALSDRTRLSWNSVGIFSFVGPSSQVHVGGYARLPETEDLMCRLELYSMIASTGCLSIKESLKTFLKDRTWGVSGQSACLMMQEGMIYFDEIRELLHDPTPEIALQSAFILGFYAQDEEALKVLESAFDQASRQMKEYILYAIATIGAKSALPFLQNALDNPFESLRVSAARGILICLYR